MSTETLSDPPSRKLLAVGECMGLLIATGGLPLLAATEFRATIAGAESNVAVGVSRLGHQAAFAGRVGDDAFGRRVRRALRAEGVAEHLLAVDASRPTGVLLRDALGDRPIEVRYQRAGSAGSVIESLEIDDDELGPDTIVHTSGITAMLSDKSSAAVEALLRRARACGSLISFDVNLRRTLAPIEDWGPRIRPLLALVDILFVSVDEAEVVTDFCTTPSEIVDSLHASGVKLVILKLGEQGATVSNGRANTARPAVATTIIDSVGAGDAVASGFLSSLLSDASEELSDLDLEAALSRGMTSAALVLGVAGDIEGLPDAATLDLVCSSSIETRR